MQKPPFVPSLFILALLACQLSSAPLTPLRRFQSLVAGVPEIGTNDGSFIDARFHTPSGILFDKSRYCLFVADAGSGQIRQIDLKDANRVSTLYPAGQGLLSPTTMAWLPEPDELLILDKGRNNIAGLKVQEKKVDWFFPLSPTTSAPAWTIGTMAPAGATSTGALILAPTKAAKLAMYSLQDPSAQPIWFTLSGTAETMNILDIRPQSHGIVVILEVGASRRIENWSLFGSAPFPWDSFAALSALAKTPLIRTLVPAATALTPTAFLRQSADFPRVLNAHDPLGVVLKGQGGTLEQWPTDEYGRSLSSESNKIFNYEAQPIGEDQQQQGKLFFEGLSAGCFDKETLTWYMSDPKNHRIVSYRELGIRALRDKQNGWGWVNYPAARHPNTKRVWLTGPSNTYYSGDGPGRVFDALSLRLERHLNVFSSLKGLDASFEVSYFGGNSAFAPNGLCRTATFIPVVHSTFASNKPDVIIVCVNPDEIYLAAQDFGKRPLDAEGLPFTPFDPESLEDPNRLQTLSKDYQALVSHIRSKPKDITHLWIDKKSMLQIGHNSAANIFGKDLADKESFSLVAAFIKIYLTKIDEAIVAESAKNKVPKPRVVLLGMPMQWVMEKEERQGELPGDGNTVNSDQAFAQFAAGLGWEYIDTIAPIRTLGPDFPFMFMNNKHPSKNGYDFISMVTAFRMLEAAPSK